MSKFALLTTLLLLLGSAVADVVAPDCLLSWSWTFNSLGQNACTVAAFLLSTCNTGSYTVVTLPPGYEYTGPSGTDDGDLCKCNTVVYNLMSACGACQSHVWITWSEFSLNCTTKLPPSTFPNPVPAGTRVPQWALLDPTPQNNWNNVTAYATGDSPELAPGAIISPPNASTSHSSGPTSTSASSVSSTPPSPTKGSSSNPGAIAGGVIGGIAVISIAIVAVSYFVRRQRSGASLVIYDPPLQPPVDEVRQSLPASYVPPLGTSTTVKPRLDIQDPNVPTTIHGNQTTQTTQNPPPQGSLLFNTAGNNLSTLPFSPPPDYGALSPI